MFATLFFVAVAAQAAESTPPSPVEAAPAAKVAAKTRLVILDLTANDVDKNLVKTISEAIAVGLQKQAIVDDVVSAADLRAMMDVEADKRALGADCEMKESCMAEVAQALGADVLVHGAVGRFGELYTVSLSIFDARNNRAIAREKVESEKLELLSRKVDFATKRLAFAYEGKSLELAGAEPTEPGGGVSPLLLAGVGVGALGAIGAVVGGLLASSAAQTLENPASSGAEKDSAQDTHPIFLATALGGGVVAAAGAGLVAASLLVE
jgi:hypothetical protein